MSMRFRVFSVLRRKVLAERLGFEPRLPVKVNTLSKRAPSATRPSLQRVNRIASAGMIEDRAPDLDLEATGALMTAATKA
jgi:hypothetical protein